MESVKGGGCRTTGQHKVEYIKKKTFRRSYTDDGKSPREEEEEENRGSPNCQSLSIRETLYLFWPVLHGVKRIRLIQAI